MSNGTANKLQTTIYWLIPVGLLLASFGYWCFVAKTTVAFPAFVALVPFLFSMVGVGTATKRWQVWSWKLPTWHVSLQYAGYASLVPLAFKDALVKPFSVLGVVELGVLAAVLIGLSGTVFDLHSMEERMLTVHHTSGWSTVNAVTSYSYRFFGFLGVCVGVQNKIGYYYMVESGRPQLFWILTLASTAVMTLPVLAYFGAVLWSESRAQRASAPPAGAAVKLDS